MQDSRWVLRTECDVLCHYRLDHCNRIAKRLYSITLVFEIAIQWHDMFT